MSDFNVFTDPGALKVQNVVKANFVAHPDDVRLMIEHEYKAMTYYFTEEEATARMVTNIRSWLSEDRKQPSPQEIACNRAASIYFRMIPKK